MKLKIMETRAATMRKIKSFANEERGAYNLNNLWMAGIGLVITGVVLSVGARVISRMQNGTNQTTEPEAYAVLTNALAGLSELGSWLSTIALVIAGVLIIGLIIAGFGGLGGGMGE